MSTSHPQRHFVRPQPLMQVRGVHFDLKGLPPTPRRLIELLELFAAGGYNAVLMEWEDMFPWTVDPGLRNPTAYSPQVIQDFANRADELGVQVIPLVQCLGHMETPLSLPKYHHLREESFRSDVINVLAPGAGELVRAMVDDVLALLPNVKYFHLGGDEAWSFGRHPDTKAYIEKHGKDALYLHHVQPLLDHLHAQGKRAILWHDMMIEWSPAALAKLAEKADLMVWGYGEHPDETKHHFATKYIEHFAKHHVPMWGGTAYKGANGPDSNLPDVTTRIDNAHAWTQVGQRFGFKGVIATAWSRYNTTAMQCEPIDGALDAALAVAWMLHDGALPDEWQNAVEQSLKSLGEFDRWRACHAALSDLSRRCWAGWNSVRMLRQLVAAHRCDPRSCAHDSLVHWWGCLRVGNAETRRAGRAFEKAVQGCMDPIWIKLYLTERIGPLEDELAANEPLIKKLNPESYAALMAQTLPE